MHIKYAYCYEQICYYNYHVINMDVTPNTELLDYKFKKHIKDVNGFEVLDDNGTLYYIFLNVFITRITTIYYENNETYLLQSCHQRKNFTNDTSFSFS